MRMREVCALGVAVTMLSGCNFIPDESTQKDGQSRKPARTDTVGQGELHEEDGKDLPPDLRGPYVKDTNPANPKTALRAVTEPRTPQDAARSYALLFTNWTWRTYRNVYVRMQARSTGRQQEDVARTSPASGPFLRFLAKDRVTNQGTVQESSLDRLRGNRATVLVAVDELPGGRGGVPKRPLKHTYKAELLREGKRWLVDRFERQLE